MYKSVNLKLNLWNFSKHLRLSPQGFTNFKSGFPNFTNLFMNQIVGIENW